MYEPVTAEKTLNDCCVHLLTAIGLEIMYPERAAELRRAQLTRRPSPCRAKGHPEGCPISSCRPIPGLATGCGRVLLSLQPTRADEYVVPANLTTLRLRGAGSRPVSAVRRAPTI
jgi:hypothetical protein